MRLRLSCIKPSISHPHLQATSLGPPHGDCGNTTLHWYRGVHYSRARCNRDCEVTQLLDACNCTNFYMPGNAPTGKHDMDIPKHFRTPLKYHNGLQFYVRNLVQALASPSHLLAQQLGCSRSNALISFFSMRWLWTMLNLTSYVLWLCTNNICVCVFLTHGIPYWVLKKLEFVDPNFRRVLCRTVECVYVYLCIHHQHLSGNVWYSDHETVMTMFASSQTQMKNTQRCQGISCLGGGEKWYQLINFHGTCSVMGVNNRK